MRRIFAQLKKPMTWVICLVAIFALVVAETFPHTASAAITLAQTRTGTKTSGTGTTFTVTMSTNTVSGNSVFCMVANDSATTNSTTGLAATGMTFTKVKDQVEGTSGGAIVDGSLWQAVNITGATAPAITVTFTAGLIGGAICREYSGLATSPGDQSASANNGASLSASPNSGATATLTGSNDLVIGAATTGDSGNTYTAGAGYGNATTLKVGTTLDIGMEDKILSGSTAAQTATFTITNSSNWAAIVATYQELGGGGGGGTVADTTSFDVSDY